MIIHGSKQNKAASHNASRGVITLSGWVYDLMVQWFVMRGKEATFRRIICDLAQLQPGEAVLDVGCGTGTQALAAKRRVGQAGHVSGIDPSPKLLATARHKARHAGLPIDFQPGGIEHIPAPPQSFNVVLSTFMMHHVPDDLKIQGLEEITRVLRPGGRLVIIDFKHSEEHEHKPEEFGAGNIALQELPALLATAGFSHIETGKIPFRIRSAVAAHSSYGFIKAIKD